jgi:hypothetical protein
LGRVLSRNNSVKSWELRDRFSGESPKNEWWISVSPGFALNNAPEKQLRCSPAQDRLCEKFKPVQIVG